MTTKIVGVRFPQPDGSGYSEKIYYYKDAIGCKVDDIVVAETYKGPQVVKVVCVNCTISNDLTAEKELKHILSKVDSTYMRATEKYKKNKAMYVHMLSDLLSTGLYLFDKFDIIIAMRSLAKLSDKNCYDDFIEDAETLEKLHKEIMDYESRCK